MKKNILLTFALALIFNISANASDINVYPVPAVFNTYKGIGSDKFKELFNNSRKDFINAYMTTFEKYFPNANSEISDKTKYKTFAAYINIPRVSFYPVQKTDKLLDIYMPLTMSINFANMATGETLCSYPVTNYYKYETTIQKDEITKRQNIEELYKSNYEQTLDEIVNQASKNFTPLNITTKIFDTYKSFYILDKGSNIGIAKGDLLSDENMNQISVVYSDLNYSVAEKVLGNPKINGNFTKFTTSSITQLKKPKVLFINDIGNEMVYSLFLTALGKEAPFSLLSTDRNFNEMQEALVSLNMDFKTKNLYNRAIPDYFMKLYFLPPAYGQFKSDKDYLNIDKYTTIACGVIFDKSGRVAYSKCSDDEMINKVVSEIRFKDDANIEIVTKNIFNKLADSMKKDIQFKNIKYKITKINNDHISLKDSNGFLKTGNILTVFKKIKTEKSGKKILVPTWDYRVVQTENDTAECKASKPYLDRINFPGKNDIVLMTALTRSNSSASMLNYNPDEIELDGNEITIRNFEQIAFAALSSKLNMPVAMHPTDFAEQIKELNSMGFRDRIEISENYSENTIKAVYKIIKKQEKEKENIIEKEYELLVGIVQKKGDKIIKQDGVLQTVKIVIPKEKGERLLQQELVRYLYPLIEKVAAKF